MGIEEQDYKETISSYLPKVNKKSQIVHGHTSASFSITIISDPLNFNSKILINNYLKIFKTITTNYEKVEKTYEHHFKKYIYIYYFKIFF